MPKARLFLRIDFERGESIGPGKIRLLESLSTHGSLSAAARELKMSYRRAWVLVNSLNATLGTPVAAMATGGRGGGGARLTRAGDALVRRYRALEAAARKAGATHLKAIASRR
jgi:molybdate transport system regulatory protein